MLVLALNHLILSHLTLHVILKKTHPIVLKKKMATRY